VEQVENSLDLPCDSGDTKPAEAILPAGLYSGLKNENTFGSL